jgi:hypothetical protein
MKIPEINLLNNFVKVFNKVRAAVADARNYDDEYARVKSENAKKFKGRLEVVWVEVLAVDRAIDGFLTTNIRRLRSLSESKAKVREHGQRVHDEFEEQFQSLLGKSIHAGRPEQLDPIEKDVLELQSQKVKPVGPTIADLGGAAAFGVVTGIAGSQLCGEAGCIALGGTLLISGPFMIILAAAAAASAAWLVLRGIGWCIDEWRQRKMNQKMKAVDESLREMVAIIEEIRQQRDIRIQGANDGVKIAHSVRNAIPDFLSDLLDWETTRAVLLAAVQQLEQVHTNLSKPYIHSSSSGSSTCLENIEKIITSDEGILVVTLSAAVIAGGAMMEAQGMQMPRLELTDAS